MSDQAKEERLKALAQSWRNLALGYEIRGKKAPDAGEVKRYAAMNGTMLHCAEALEKALAGRRED